MGAKKQKRQEKTAGPTEAGKAKPIPQHDEEWKGDVSETGPDKGPDHQAPAMPPVEAGDEAEETPQAGEPIHAGDESSQGPGGQRDRESRRANLLHEVVAAMAMGVDLGSPDGAGPGLLREAVEVGDRRVFRLLLEEGAPVDHTPPGEKPLLHLVAEPRLRGYLREALAHAKNPDAADARGRTLLHRFAAGGDLEGLSMLLGAGADPNTQDARGMTPLHLAARKPRRETTIRALAQAGARLETKDRQGRTALAAALMTGRMDSVKALLALGAEDPTGVLRPVGQGEEREG